MSAAGLEGSVGRDLDATGARILFETLGATSEQTRQHSVRVGRLAGELGQALPGVSDETVRALGLAGTVHDVGKTHPRIAGLVDLPRAFDEREAKMFRFIHTHFGGNMIGSLQPPEGYEELVDIAAFVAFHHHDDMAELARRNGADPTKIMINNMIQVIDVFDAVQDHNRPYNAHPLESPEEAGELIMSELEIPELFGVPPDEITRLLVEAANEAY